MNHLFASVLVLCFRAVQSSAPPLDQSKFKNWAPPKDLNRTVEVGELKYTFATMMQGAGTGDEQLSMIEAAMMPTYRALPKNEFQGLTHSATSYLVHEYFARTYQWHLRGLGSGPNGAEHGVAPLHEATILQDMAPQLVEGLLQAKESGRGLSLSDAAAMAATLHHLVRSDAEMLLEKAYELLDQPMEAPIDKWGLSQTVLAFAYASSGQLEKPKDFFVKRLKRPTHYMGEFFKNAINIAETLAFQQRGQMNPFLPRTWDFNNVLDLVERVLREFGRWQDSSCSVMRDHLNRLDPNGAGRVPLGVFYAQPDMGAYRFSESSGYLQETGSLDSSVAGRPQVLISNYVLGPGNCFSSSTYFQFCCVNSCSSVMAEIENYVVGPAAAAQDVLYAVGNASARLDMDLDLAEQTQELPALLVEKLHTIAKRHDGVVPLHGRLFAQWLHFAYPTTCPYPHIPTSGVHNGALTASDFMNSKSADANEMQRHIEASGGPDSASERSLSQWTDDEIFPFLDALEHSSVSFRGIVRVAALCLILVATIVSLIRSARAADDSLKLTAMDKLV